VKKFHFSFPAFILGGCVAVLLLVAFYLRIKTTMNVTLPYYSPSAFVAPAITPIVRPPQLKAPIKIPILMYHYVEYVTDKRDTIRQQLDIVPAVFENQVKTLQEASYSALFINDVADILFRIKPVPEKPIVLTFDDGYGDFYTDVFPILKKYHMKATVYIIPGFLDRLNYMTSSEVQEIAESGLVEIAAHTMHHLNLKSVPDEVAINEIQGSKVQLEVLTGKDVKNFAYPYGEFNQHTADLVEKIGFRSAVSVVSGDMQSMGNRYYLSRLRAGARTGNLFLAWLEQVKK
jgi:peptidoglycan/xylan/chitin deacetylase (PgdA/CDA1 family)